MAYDVNGVLQSLTTKTATFNGSGFDLKTGTPRRGMHARCIVSAYSSVATAGSVFTFAVQHSSDDTTYTTIAQGDPITGATAAATAERIIPFATKKRYVRLSVTVSPSSGTPSIAYLGELGLGFPNP